MNRLLNLGSLNIDHVYQVSHFVRPGETLSSAAVADFPGGKGLNQSIAAARAGVKVSHAGKIGPDGRFLLELLSENGVDTAGVLAPAEGRTGHAIIQVDARGQNCILLYGGANRAVTEEEILKALSPFSAGDALLVQNEISHVPFAIRAAAERGMRVVLNPSPMTGELERWDLSGVALFVLNELEGAALSGGETEPRAILSALERRYPGAEVVLTLGTDGSFCRCGADILYQPAFSVQAVDTTAAGDTFLGYFLSGWLSGRPTAETLRTASAASAIAVTRAGAACSIPTPSEVQAFLSGR